MVRVIPTTSPSESPFIPITDPSCPQGYIYVSFPSLFASCCKGSFTQSAMLFFSHEIFTWNSTNGLQSRARKWLFTLTTFVFALSTAYWILSVFFTFASLEYASAATTNQIDPDDYSDNFVHSAELLVSVCLWLESLGNILFINVSAVLYRVLVEHPHLVRKHSP
jgi:hypothetical protein